MFRVETRDGVSLLRMDDGKVNALGPDFVDAFPEAWRKASENDRAVVLVGNARAFSAGLDLKRLPGLERTELLRFARGFMGLFRDVLQHERPVVAAVDGPALAGGAILAMCADFRLVGPNARMGLTEVPVGIPFPRPVVDIARDTLPAPELAPALLDGRIRTGRECIDHGWAHTLSESARLEEDAIALARTLGAHPAGAYGAAKRVMHDATAAAFASFVESDAAAWTDRVASSMDEIRRGFERATARK